jgi:hypothetical protein
MQDGDTVGSEVVGEAFTPVAIITNTSTVHRRLGSTTVVLDTIQRAAEGAMILEWK